MKWFLVFALWSTSVAHAQVNIEKLRSADIDDGLTGSVGLSTSLSTGNVQFADFSGKKNARINHESIKNE